MTRRERRNAAGEKLGDAGQYQPTSAITCLHFFTFILGDGKNNCSRGEVKIVELK